MVKWTSTGFRLQNLEGMAPNIGCERENLMDYCKGSLANSGNVDELLNVAALVGISKL